jgi:hypothetical protein
MRPTVIAMLVVAGAVVAASAAHGAPAPDCAAEAAALDKEQSDLPKLEFASPADRPPYCITLETNMAFALRLKAHVAHCPQSDYAPKLAEWEKTRADYGRRFSQYRCRRTL